MGRNAAGNGSDIVAEKRRETGGAEEAAERERRRTPTEGTEAEAAAGKTGNVEE